ncbi:MAG: TonB-dependent receptor [Saprospiraceae bacterium]|nr:TonB-dependent receptor [Saprospiraceae bacterium]
MNACYPAVRYHWIIIVWLFSQPLFAQNATIKGRIMATDQQPLEYALVALKEKGYSIEPASDGTFVFKNIPHGTYTILGLALGKQTTEQLLVVNRSEVEITLILQDLSDVVLNEIVVMQEQERALGIQRLQSIQNFTVYEGKKNEIILLDNLVINKATNNARQIYGAITGLNIWESDGGGLQLGIGGRGLSPNRTSNFNTRQNGYDISADALGYPESYYTPPSEAINKVEVIRGAAGLQYGTQFGGAVNFLLNKGRENVAFEYIGRQTVGSWNFLNSFNSIGGTSNNSKWNYYAFYQRKQGSGWRDNSNYHQNTAYARLAYTVGKKTNLSLEYTHTDYLAQQAGGLTDALFEQNPRQSVRSRNWFKVNWDLFAFNLTHKFSATTQLNIRNFGLLASRQALGNLERINVLDFNQNRTLIDGTFQNVGTELRFMHRYKMGIQNNIFLAGFRAYLGNTTARQGDADNLSGPNFTFLNPENVEGSDYRFPNYNYALFFEHVFKLNPKMSITPGIRLENIQTFAEGYYRQRAFDFAGNIIVDRRIEEDAVRKRLFAIAGLGMSYKPKPTVEVYANISQNYRAINFTDLRIQNPNFVIDTSLSDEKGFTADIGIRANSTNLFNYEITAFFLYYNNRIGQILRADQAPLFLDYRFRTNVAASRNIGLETFASFNLARALKGFSSVTDWTVFINATALDARYIKSKDSSIQGRSVEMVPPFILRSGTTFKKNKWKASFQVNYIQQHFSDATNATRTSTAVEGIIPSYTVSDLSAAYELNAWLILEFSCNNIFNERYFTRRAEAYPGPGIIPSDGQSFFLTAQVHFAKKNK